METTVVYVNGRNTSGPWDGLSWDTPLRTIQEGLDAAAEGGGEVWVAKGIYKPTDTQDRAAAIQLRPEVGLYGGFTGTETERGQRDWVAHETVLSGDITNGADRKRNSFHVVVGADHALIDGFTIRDGSNLPEGPRGHHMTPEILLEGRGRGTGAAILCFQTAPTIRNCVISDNMAAKGAGIYIIATRTWPPDGVHPTPTVINCTFARNYAVGRGGAVSNDLMTHSTFINCTFIDNVCDGKGGGMYNDFDCSPTLINCVFARNTAQKGGGMANDGMSCPTLTNCTFVDNYGRDMFGGLYNGTGPTNTGNNPIITNCIFWGNRAISDKKQIGNWHHCIPVVTYSCVEGGYDGEGNIDADPLFVDSAAGDYRLGPGSPCVDAGDGTVAPPKDRDGNPRYDDKGRPNGLLSRAPYYPKGDPLPPPGAHAEFRDPVDVGAYERQSDSMDELLADVVYVNAANVDGPWDGDSWATAYNDLQVGLNDAYTRAREVWVAKGTYLPTASADRRASFMLKSGLALYGGFAGTEIERDQRDWAKNKTVLSGEVGREASENSYHVVVGAEDSILDGFVITGGNANGAGPYNHGGGMVNYNGASPTVANCIFRQNQGAEGGAMYNYNLSAPVISHCAFEKNSAGKGGAMVNRVGASPQITSCRFVENEARWRGGALQIDYGSGPQISGCTFERNRSGGHGGGAFLESVAAQLGVVSTHFQDCVFEGNWAELRGGGMGNSDGGNPKVIGCSFIGNHAGKGGGGMSNDYHVVVTVDGCSFDGNSASEGQADIDTDATSRVETGA
jgi:hypothetical protein